LLVYTLRDLPLFWVIFLGAFAKLWKASTSFVMPVHPSVLMEQLSFNGMDFCDILYLRIFHKSVEKSQISL